MDIFQNEYIWENLGTVAEAGLIAFIVTFILTPFVGKLATAIKAVDLPASMRKKGDGSAASRINTEPKPKLGGIAIFIGFFIALLATDSIDAFNDGIVIGLFLIIFGGILDDKFEISGKIQFFIQSAAAFAVIYSGIAIKEISVFNTTFDFTQFESVITIADTPFSYVFIFPSHLITLLWIVGVINVVNWVGGVDALNPSISAIAASTLLLIILGDNNEVVNIVLATAIGAHVGALLGFIPYNYNPSKLIQGGTGDYLNGYLLAIFAILGSTKWTATFILYALPIIDAIIVVIMRLRAHPETRRNPLKLLTISDKNHLHHRLMDAGYSRKMVLFIEISIMLVLCSIALSLSELRRDVVAFILAGSFIFFVFTLIFYLKQRAERTRKLNFIASQNVETRRPVVKVIIDGKEDPNKEDEDSDYERFVY